MLEKYIESYLVSSVKKHGGTAYKFVSPNRRSVPDRIVCLPGGIIAFVELKATGKKPTESQNREILKLKSIGFRVEVIDSKTGVDTFINSVI